MVEGRGGEVGGGWAGDGGIRLFRDCAMVTMVNVIIRIQRMEVKKMSLMTNEIKCYICMISCIFIKQIFMVVYTKCMYVTLITVY